MFLELAQVGEQMRKKWGIKDNQRLVKLGEEVLWLHFNSWEEALRVLKEGERRFSNFYMDRDLGLLRRVSGEGRI